jgi:hemerythrin
MAHIQWTADLDTGIDVIDSQHKRIVAYINQLQDARLDGGREAVGQVVEELVDYTLSHFAFEESLMEEAGYRYLNAHKRVHELFTRRVTDYQRRFADGEDIAEPLETTLTTWLLNHIRHDDADYSEVVRGNLAVSEGGKESGWLGRSLKRFFGGRG